MRVKRLGTFCAAMMVAVAAAHPGPGSRALAQSGLAVIEAPDTLQIDTDTVDFRGRAGAPGEVTLTVDGVPVPVAADGSFRVRRQVPVGSTAIELVVEGSHGDRAAHTVYVRRYAAAAASIDYGNYVALVIGNDGYEHLADLELAVADAKAVARVLEARYGFTVRTLIDATRADIISALARLRAELTERDNLLIYYAGHGSLDVGSDEGYWLPVDAAPDNPVNWISNATITGQLRAMAARHVMVVADSCYAGKLTRNVAAQLRTGAERTAWLARMNARRSRTALTSGGLEPVVDAGGGTHSVFAKAFLEALRENAAVMDGASLFDSIKRPVVVNADQTPEYADIRKAGHDGGDFLFVPTATAVAAAPADAPAAASGSGDAQRSSPLVADREALFWHSIEDSDDPAMFDEYLRQFPDGVFAGLARLKRDALVAASRGDGPEAAAESPPASQPEPAAPGEAETAALAPQPEAPASSVAAWDGDWDGDWAGHVQFRNHAKCTLEVAVRDGAFNEDVHCLAFGGRSAWVFKGSVDRDGRIDGAHLYSTGGWSPLNYVLTGTLSAARNRETGFAAVRIRLEKR